MESLVLLKVEYFEIHMCSLSWIQIPVLLQKGCNERLAVDGDFSCQTSSTFRVKELVQMCVRLVTALAHFSLKRGDGI